jgi:hypothetical protein
VAKLDGGIGWRRNLWFGDFGKCELPAPQLVNGNFCKVILVTARLPALRTARTVKASPIINILFLNFILFIIIIIFLGLEKKKKKREKKNKKQCYFVTIFYFIFSNNETGNFIFYCKFDYFC